MKKWSIFALAAVLAIAAITLQASAADKLKVGFVYLGPVGDPGWTFQHDAGRKNMMAALGDRVETTYLENVPESADAERALEKLVRSGHQLIFATSFGYMDQTLRVAEKYPNVHFEHETGYKRAANVSTYDARWYEGDYLPGGDRRQNLEIWRTRMDRSIPNPAGDFWHKCLNPRRAERQSEHQAQDHLGKHRCLIRRRSRRSQGTRRPRRRCADDVHQFAYHHASCRAAWHSRIGSQLRHDQVRPHAQLSATVNNWGPYYTKHAEDELAGKWKSEATWAGLDSNVIVMAPYTNMPDDAKKLASDTEAAIKAGTLHPFKCPVVDPGWQQCRMQRRQPSRRPSNPKA